MLRDEPSAVRGDAASVTQVLSVPSRRSDTGRLRLKKYVNERTMDRFLPVTRFSAAVHVP